jgi:methylated-DNA-[protein]-cysteine S-methyltransferase
MNHYFIFETVRGFCAIAWNRLGITCLRLPAHSADAAGRNLSSRRPDTEPRLPTPEVAEVIASAQRYFEGERVEFTDTRLDLGEQSESFSQIYAAARRVGWGHTTTYGSLARALGAGPEFAREVGQAMARNPVPLIIPCHRVLAAGGKIGGFSAPGGAATKLHMLELEGVHAGQPPSPQQSLQW